MRRRIRLFGVEIDSVCMAEVVMEIQTWLDGNNPCRYVVTPNVDHTVMLRENESLRRVYADADLILADGAPVVLASRLLGKPLPERVAGSDLVPAICATADSDTPVTLFLLGAGPGVADRAAHSITARWSAVKVVGTYSPPFGFENDDEENERILTMINDASPDILVVGLGAPKQELWVHRHRSRLGAKAALCVGASIDFLAGEKRRAPKWIRSIGFEWAHRLMSEPRRLAKRYARDAWIFPQLIWNEWRGARSHV